MSRRSKRKVRHMPPFPCVACGACCRRLTELMPDAATRAHHGLVADADGACDSLTADGRCDRYETRPRVCRISEAALPYTSQGSYYEQTAAKCNEWIQEDGGEELVQIGRS